MQTDIPNKYIPLYAVVKNKLPLVTADKSVKVHLIVDQCNAMTAPYYYVQLGHMCTWSAAIQNNTLSYIIIYTWRTRLAFSFKVKEEIINGIMCAVYLKDPYNYRTGED